MSGSGGRSYENTQKLSVQVQKAMDDFFDKNLEADVSAYLSKVLAYANNRDSEAINLHITEILKALEKNIEGSINSLFGGSVAKHTFVDGLSDVDTLIIINDSDLVNKSPIEVKDYIAQRLQERFPSTEVKTGKLAITIKFNDYDIQIIPAINRGNYIKIPASSGDHWSDKIRPKEFTKELSDINSQLSNKVIPVIKLAKSIIYSYPEQKRLTGYHIESLATEIFKNYTGKITTENMLMHFFNAAYDYVLKPMKDKTGQSTHIDDYLKSENSLEREIVADALRNTSKKMKIAKTLEQWQLFFE